MNRNARLFLDTSALFAGLWSAEGGARMLLRLGEAGSVDLYVSSQGLSEIDDVIRRKAEQILSLLAVTLDRSQVKVVPDAPIEEFEKAFIIVHHPGDARILADAWHNQVDFLVTLDKAHFLDLPGLAEKLPFLLGTPGDALGWLRRRFIVT